uniref:Uncharacterized protein n=1 Tax=Acrobeloides nanus TaxID=290746 RepID=A0A914CK69_9BILA
MLLVVNTLDFTGSRPVTSFPSSAPSWPADDTLSSNHSVSQHPTRSDFPHLTPLTRNLQDGHNQRDLGRHGDQDDDSILKKLRNSSRLKDQRIPLPPESGQRPGDQLITPGTSSSATSKETFERSSHPTTGRSTNNVDYDLIIEQDNQNTIYHALNSDSNTIITAVMSDSSPDLK